MPVVRKDTTVRSVALVVAAIAAVAVASCGAPGSNVPKLGPVSVLPNPSLPPWIASISPTGTADTLAQIRVVFAKPVTPVEALASAGTQGVLSHVRIDPALQGHFTLLTPRMIGFVPDQALPIGTRVRITLTSGLRDLAGDALGQDLAWTFETAPLEFADMPGTSESSDEQPTPLPVRLQPKVRVRANAAVDTDSLASHALFVAGNNETVSARAELEAQPTPFPGSGAEALFDPQLNAWDYNVSPLSELRRGTTYKLVILKGVEPRYGNLPTVKDAAGYVRTFGVLAIVPTPSASPDESNRFAAGDPVIAFTNALDPASVARAVTISPAPASMKQLVTVSDWRSDVIAIDPYALDPDATYTATVSGSVKDIYGQTLGQDQTVTIRTSDFAPGAWAPSGTSIFPAAAAIALNFYATNLPGNTYQAAYARMSPLKLLGSPRALDALPSYRTWPSQKLNARRNVQSVVSVPIQTRLGGRYGALAYGFRTGLDATNSDPDNTGIVQLTNLGVFAQWFPSHGMVLVQRLSDGAPVAGATVAVYRIDQDNKVAPQQCATGTTAADGQLNFYGVDVERCAATAASNQGPNLGVVVTQAADVATVTAWNWSGVSRYDVNSGWTSGAPLSRGTIFSDRQMYQPGERGQITGIAYYVKGSAVVADTNANYRVKLVDPDNNETPLQTVKTDSFGVFSLPITFSKEQALGYYTVDAKGANGNDISGSLRVAQFKPPNFKLTLALDATSTTAGASVAANVAAAYLFGAPLQGGTAHAYVTRDLANVQPTGWDQFSFGPQWYYPEETPSFDTDVLQRDLALDAQGKASLGVAVPRDLPFPMNYRVDMEASDVSNLSVSDSKSFTAWPADAAIGLASDAVGPAGTPMNLRVIVTDANGKAIAGRAVHLQLQKMTYTAATQEVEGGENAQQSIKYDTVGTADATSGDGPVTVQLTPNDAGPYRVYANFGDAKSEASNSSIQVFAFGAGEADWGWSDPNAVAVKLDKKKYAIGETASVLVASPYDNGDVYFSVVRNDVLYRTLLRGVHGAVRLNFKVTEAMLPNAAVQAIVVRRQRGVTLTLRQAQGKGDTTLAVTGMAAFDVDLSGRYLKLAIAPRNATVHPGAQQHVDFAVSSNGGTPAKSEVVAMVVNDAILQLSGYRLPDLVQTVFAQQPIATIFADNRENVTLKTQTPPMEKGFGYGGGFLAGAASTRIRANFQPLAYYRVLQTDASGHAAVDFAMPDDLTTWRVMAVALAQDRMHFATADSTFVSNQPLIANPLLPQFARPNDRFDLGLSIANQTGAGGALEFVLQLTGALAFAQGDPKTMRGSEQVSTGVQAFRFPVVVGTPAPTEFQAQATLGAHSDGLRVPFTPSDRESTDSVIESGATRGEASIPIALNAGGTLQVTLANSVVPQFVTPSERAMTADAFPLTDIVASRLTIAAALKQLQTPYRLKLAFDPAAASAASLTQLLALQRGDGGFGAFTNDTESDPFATASALQALVFARAHGVGVDSAAVANAAGFMSHALANPGIFKWCAPDPGCKAMLRFEALWALAQVAPPRTDFLTDIVAQSQNFDSATQIRLTRYLLRAPGWQSRGAAMAAQLQQSVYVAGRYSVASNQARWAWLGSLVEAQAQMLQLLLERHAPAEQLDGAVRALVSQQCRCGWPTTDDTASAVTALSAYAATERLTAGTATATAGSRTIGTAQFGNTASSQTFAVPASALQNGAPIRVTLSLSKGGTLHYLILYTYPVPPNAPGELAAFRVIRTLSDPTVATSSTRVEPLATMDIAAAQPVSVAVGRVFDVGVRAILDHPVDRFFIDDPLPAGFEAVDTSFRTSLQAIVPQSNSWQIDASQIYSDRVVAFAQHLDPGVYELHYLVRSVTPGAFSWPGARVYLKDAPEQFGRSAGSTLNVTQ
ncbi:MAG TPA: Ig-like domain-containing protein [Candidatus Cybelea sp.]